MKKAFKWIAALLTGVGTSLVLAQAGGMGGGQAPAMGAATPPPMGFFITSVSPGMGGDLGGLAGADAHCQNLAAAVGAGDRTWRAYLSTQATDSEPAINARDRIGTGPWANAKGVVMANSVEDLHFNNANLIHENMLTEKGEMIKSTAVGDDVNHHDILTGSQMDGTAFPPGEDRTCSNWTSSDEGSAYFGHSDRYRMGVYGSSWNAAHGSRGCSEETIPVTGSAGQFYCFAADSGE